MTVPPPLEAGAASNVVMDHLIPIINKLQDAFASVGLAGLDLPQIAGMLCWCGTRARVSLVWP